MKLQAPRVCTPSLADLAEGAAADALEPEGTDGLSIEGAAFVDVSRRDVIFRETEFLRAFVSGGEFTGCRFLDVRFDGADAPEFVAPRSTLRDVEFLGSRFGVLGLHDTELSGVRFDHCKIGFLGLQGAVVSDLTVENCAIDELDLTDATVNRAVLRDVTLGTLRLPRSRLGHVDLRGARLSDVSPMAALSGAILGAEQVRDLAPLLAQEIGIHIDPG